MTPSALQQRFQTLDAWLYNLHEFWQSVPFKQRELAWEGQHPILSGWLRALSPADVDALEQSPEALYQALAQHLSDFKHMPALISLKHMDEQPRPMPPARLAQDVPGRKWQQIEAFSSGLPGVHGDILDWCAGKGHLARVLNARLGQPVQCLEWDEALCDSGRQLSRRFQLAVKHLPCDVMQADAAQHIGPHTHGVALHACGSLHRRLIELSILSPAAALSLSPCCYHLEPEGAYRPFSQAGRHALVQPEREALRLCVQETVTGGQRVARLRKHTQAWRLGFDLLQREVRGVDEYLPIPSSPPDWLNLGFQAFCHRLAAAKGLALPNQWDADRFEAAGWVRQQQVAALDLFRHAFRRPLELWLVLDRALALEEAGFDVEVGEFCPRHLTPRNIMIHAVRASS